jgi:hypothetical protein
MNSPITISCIWTDLEKQIVFLTSLDPSVEGQMFPLQLLRSPLAYHMLVWIQMSVIGTSAISVEATNAQRCEQRFQC